MSTLKEVIAGIEKKLDPAKTPGMNAVYQFDLTGDEAAIYCLTFTEGVGKITEGASEKPDITITMKASDFIKLVSGKLNPTMAFMTGKIKIKGDMGLVMKLQ